MADSAAEEMETDVQPGPSEPPPSRTLYVNNLAERPRKEGARAHTRAPAHQLLLSHFSFFARAEMKKCLLSVFGQFGTGVDVVLSKAYKLRGQAWVIFASEEEAAEAKAMMEGFPLYEKPLVRTACTRAPREPCR
jgi:RNA recognition motif-containing protein